MIKNIVKITPPEDLVFKFSSIPVHIDQVNVGIDTNNALKKHVIYLTLDITYNITGRKKAIVPLITGKKFKTIDELAKHIEKIAVNPKEFAAVSYYLLYDLKV